MLPQAHRLRSDADFRRAYRKGKAFPTTLFRIHIFYHNTGVTRIGIVLSNKIIKKATLRNKKKRQLRAIFRELAPIMKSGYDVVVTCLPSAVPASFEQMQNDVTSKLKTTQIIEHDVLTDSLEKN